MKKLILLLILTFLTGFTFPKVKDYEKIGDKYLIEKNYKKAEKYYKKAIKKKPQNAKLHFKLALAYKERGKTEKCLKELIRCTQIDPNFEKPYLYLADFFSLSKKYEKAEKAYLNLLRIKPNSPKYNYLLGKLLFLEHKDEESLKYFYKAVQLDHGFKEAYPYLKELLKREILRNPDNPDPHLKLGNVFYFNNELQKAKVQYVIYLEKKPQSEKVWYKLLKICKELKECDCTIKTYEALLEFYPSSEEITKDLVKWALKCGNTQKAILYLKREYEINPENIEALKKLGDIYRKEKNNENAYYYYRLYLKKASDKKIERWCKDYELVKPEISSMFSSLEIFNTGLKFFKEGNFQRALDYFKKAEKIYEKYPQIHFYKGRTLYELGKKEDCLSEYKEAILLDKYNPEYWFYLGISLNEIKKYKDAAVCFRKCIEFSNDPNSMYYKTSYKFLKKYISSGIIDKERWRIFK